MAILQSFLGFRAALHKIGLTKGFQWINGSFVEFIELIEGRPPVDIDVTTFYYLPEDVANQQQLFDLNRDVFDHAATKRIYNVDAYFVELNSSPLEPLIENVTYWNSLWSHRRIDLWKGYLQLDLAHDEDVTAGELLKGMMHQGGQA